MLRIFSYILGFVQKKYFLIAAGLIFSGSCLALEDSEVLTNIVVLMNLVLSLILLVITPAIILAGWLLSPDWTMGDFFGLREYFLDIWVLVSNIVYIIFALLLLYMAIMQIFSGESEFAFKQKLPQFLVGILIVPFTWLIVSWTLSFANQAVAAVLSIPMGAIGSLNTNDPKTSAFHKRVIPTVLSFSLGEGQGKESQGCRGGQTTVSNGNGGTETVNCISPAEFVTHNGSGPFFIILIYAYDIFQINTADMVAVEKLCKTTVDGGKDSSDCIKDLMGIIRSAGLGLIVTTFFGILIVALCWVLLARALKLWIYVMFSPLFGLAYFSGNGWGESFHSEGGGGGGGGDSGMTKLGFVPFLKLAMVPVLVAAVLSFGLLFIGVMRSSFTGNQDGDSNGISQGETVCSKDDYLVRYCITRNSNADSNEGYESSLVIGSDTADGGEPGEYAIQFKFGTSFSPFINDAVQGDSAIGALGGAVDSVEDIFAHIIITMIALAIIWTGVQAAVQHDAVTSAAFKPFEQLGHSTINMIKQVPSMIPLPHPALAALTPQGIKAISQGINSGLATAEANRAKDLMSVLQNPGDFQAANEIRNGTAQTTDAIKALGDRLLSTENGRSAAKDRLKSIVGAKVENDAEKERLLKDIDKAGSDASAIQAVAVRVKTAVGESKLDATEKSFFDGVASSSSSSSGNGESSATVDDGSGRISGLQATSGSIPIADINPNNLNANQKAALKNDRNKTRLNGFISNDEKAEAKTFIAEAFGIDVPINRSIELSRKLIDLSTKV